MKKNYRACFKILLAVLACTYLNAEAFMGAPEVACSYSTSDCPAYMLGFDFRALFLKPYTANSGYVALPNINNCDTHSKTHFGFELGFGTLFLCNNTNLTVNWQHFSSCNSAFEGKINNKFDEVMVNWGQLFTFDCLQLNFTAGVCYTRIEELLKSRFANFDDTRTSGSTFATKFSGAGPQIELDLSYALFNNFCLVGKTAAALLVGKIKNSTTAESLNSVLTNVKGISIEVKRQVIPAFKERLGVSYYFNFCDSFCVNIEGGYDAKIYLSALQIADFSQRSLDNFALVGPYISISAEF